MTITAKDYLKGQTMIVNHEKTLAIVERFGANHQRFKAAEELSELQTLILQDANSNGKIPLNRIVEEIADVYVMLQQLQIIYYIDSRDIEPVIAYKLDRTLTDGRRSDKWEDESRSLSEKTQTD